jgi:hypothetical protein
LQRGIIGYWATDLQNKELKRQAMDLQGLALRGLGAEPRTGAWLSGA